MCVYMFMYMYVCTHHIHLIINAMILLYEVLYNQKRCVKMYFNCKIPLSNIKARDVQ